MARKLVEWPKILLLGDSQTQYGYSESGCWASLIADHFQRRCDILNRGFSGYNSRWLKMMLPQLVNADVARSSAAVVLFIGCNDACPSTSPQHVPLDEYKQSVTDIVQYLMSLDIEREKMILVTPTPVDAPLWDKSLKERGIHIVHGRTNEVITQYAAACSDAARELNVDYIDLYTEMMKDEEWQKYVSCDGLHLAKVGGQLLSTLLIPKLEKITSNCTEIFPIWSDVDSETPSNTFG